MRLACTAARNPNPISTRIFEKADKPFQNYAMPGRLCYLPGIAFFLSPFIKPLLYVEKLQIGTVLPVVSDLYREFAELSAHLICAQFNLHKSSSECYTIFTKTLFGY